MTDHNYALHWSEQFKTIDHDYAKTFDFDKMSFKSDSEDSSNDVASDLVNDVVNDVASDVATVDESDFTTHQGNKVGNSSGTIPLEAKPDGDPGTAKIQKPRKSLSKHLSLTGTIMLKFLPAFSHDAILYSY
jgi:hypothetical protein